MTEEEKKAIEFLKEVSTDDGVSREFIVEILEPIINLIDKQQKEIEELTEELQMYVDTNIEENFDTVYMKAVADFKDKIRAKIKEIENVETDKISREEYNRIEFAIEILLELLEE